MKALKTLIRLTKNTLNQQRRELVILEQSKDKIIKRSEKLAAKESSELDKIKTLDFPYPHGDSLKKNYVTQQTIIKGQLKTIITQIERQQVLISDTFSELKRYDIALSQEVDRQQAEEQPVEEQKLDEIALQKNR